MNKIPIKLYYKEDGSILNQGGLNKIPLLTKLSNYVYELILVTPLMNTEYTLYAIFEKSDGTITSPYPMDYYETEIVKVGNQQQRWYKYKTILDSDVLNISTLNYNNQIKIGFRAEFNSGEVDEQTNESIVGVFNFIPTSAYCSYTINSRNVVIDNTPLKTIIDFINTGNAGKLDKSESILLTDVEPTLITDEGSAYYNLNYLYFFTSDTQNHKKGEIVKHTLNDNGTSVLEKIPLYESVYSKYDDTQKGNPTPRSIGERFGDVSNNLNLLHQTKVDKVEGKQLSTNDFDNAYKNKIDTLDENVDNKITEAKTETKNYTDTKIADLINGSPETLDTLKELADAYQNNLDIINSLIAVLGNKANASDVYTKTQTDNALQNKVDKVNGKSLVLESEIQKLKTVEYNANHYVLPSDVPHDSNYVHTDNNFTNIEKQKLQALKNYDDSGIKQQINNVEANAKQYTNEQINELIGGASDSYNTLKELQDAFSENKDLIANLNELASKKVDKVDGKGLSTNDFTDEEKDILKYSPKPLYNGDYNYSSREMIQGAINYTHENGLKSKLFFQDGDVDSLILVVNRWADYYEAIVIKYLVNSKTVYNIVQAPVTDTNLIVVSSHSQIVDTSGSGSGGSGGSVDLSEVKSYIDEELGKIVDNAPEALNTLNELATAYTEQGEVVEALNSAINNKVDKVEGKELSSNDYTDADKEKVNILPISIPYAGFVPGAIKQALNYMKLNNLMNLSAIYNNDFDITIKIFPSGPSGMGTLGWNMEYKSGNVRYVSNNLITYDTPVEEITYSVNQIFSVPTKTSELENDSGFVTKNIIPNELNSKFAISSSTEDLTANTIKTRTDIGTSFIVRSIAYGNDTYVVVGNNANIRYLHKNSSIWGECDVSYHSTSSTFTSVTYGKGMFVCVEYYEENEEKNSILHKSLDGIEWEQIQHFNFGIENITYANGRFILVGSQGYIAFTDDLITFTPTNSKIENDIISVTYGKNRYVAVSNAGDIIYSLDGVVWNKSSIENDTTHYRVATYGKGMFIIGGQNGTIRYSYDGISWNTAIVNSNLKSINYIRAMCYYNGKFFACLYGSGASETDGEILTSIDGINWVSDLVDETNRLWAIGFGNELVLIGGDNGAIHKYNLNIEWLDYEPKINKNQVLWQKQYLTLSDGSIVESEVEVHTNMKNIYDEVLYGELKKEYNLDELTNLNNKIIYFNEKFNFDLEENKRYIFLTATKYIDENNVSKFQIEGYKYSNGYSFISIYLDNFLLVEVFKDNMLYINKFNMNDYALYDYQINYFAPEAKNIFKIYEKEENLISTIFSIKNKIVNYFPFYTLTGEDTADVFYRIVKYCKNNNLFNKYTVFFIDNKPDSFVEVDCTEGGNKTFYFYINWLKYSSNSVVSCFLNDSNFSLEYIRENIETTQINTILPFIEFEQYEEPISIENVLNDLFSQFDENTFYLAKLKTMEEENPYNQYMKLFINFSYNPNDDIAYANVMTSKGNKVYESFYDEDGNLQWKEITSKQESSIIEVEALPVGWKGTPVPTSGYVEKVYFNTALSNEEVNSIIDSLEPNIVEEDDGNVYRRYKLFMGTDEYTDVAIYLNDGNIFGCGGDIEIYYNKEWLSSYLDVAQEVMTDGLTIYQNDKLSSLISITPFEKVEINKNAIYRCKGKLYLWNNNKFEQLVTKEEPQIIKVGEDYTFDEYFHYDIDLSQNGKYLIDMSGMPKNDVENGIYYIARLNFGYMKNYNVGKLVNATYGNIDAMNAGFDGVPSYVEIMQFDSPIVFVEVEDYYVRIYGSAES